MASDNIGSVGTTALAFFVAVGSRDENPSEWGMAHLLEHLVFKGAGRRDFRAIARQMDRLGADINAFTTRDYTCFHAKVLDSEALDAYHLVRDLVLQPWLAAEDLEREKGVVVEEMNESLDDPDEVLDTLITEALYQDSHYTHDILGTPESLANIEAEGLKAFYHRWYRPENMVLAVSGGARELILKAAEQDFSGVGGVSELPRRRPRPTLAYLQREQAEDWEQAKIALGVEAPGRYQDEYWRALMLSSILGGQNSSRLWQRLREEEGLVYSVGTQYAADYDFGDMITYLSLTPEKIPQALRALFDEVSRLAEVGPDTEEVSHTRVYLNTVLVMNQETPDARVMRLGRYALDGKEAPQIDQAVRALSEITPEMVKADAQTWIPGSRMAAVAAGPVHSGALNHAMFQGRQA
ncbi:M16 family metallopeptidase [Sulfobacillus harzensis]|uniref:Insulinase family protein n=1 Tax=Sulfobacillus harzensis TaxID=2729629 RepID=A0A7Y0Q1V5_9FIRM|nr:pitrilysin family protein [Sulfobacillus harzensis]NMP21842.1 insulinase family protein [Sulfobacillus harzensis]